ncbi:MAG: ribonucleotide-diphosphate reductase subunit beta [Spirochaetaceae bacterium]|jgi:ribonucleoside-diphosphate reductase beta chain|nr:ribonucleotide-diphosphate reductase subunit beta [Spirochaetaceae bacterium]
MAIHTDTFTYCCDSLGLDPDVIYSMYETIPSIKQKDDFVVRLTQNVFNKNFQTQGMENIRQFVHDLIGYYVIMEGIFFFAGFAMILAMKRQKKMVGIGEQFEYIMRD